MSLAAVAQIILALLFGSAITIQLFAFPSLVSRVTDRSTVTRVSHELLRSHHTLSVILLLPAIVLLFISSTPLAGSLASLLCALNLYQRFWLFTKLHLVKQPIGVQDLIQPDNVLREQMNKLQQMIYRIFRMHTLLLLIDLLVSAF